MNKFTNALANESSPYLLQHAHNPVQWYPWGREALDRAKAEDKPVLVSIGYAACHWCHVMERESFENEDTARLMNELFINIKIDREERPDLDHIYMDAVQAIAGNGGWPLNVFLTPECKPFYGGTYFPPVRAHNRSSWPEVLNGVSNLFKEKRSEVEAQAEELTKHIGQSSNFISKLSTEIPQDEQIFHKQQLDEIFEQLMKQADKSWGGFGNAPKFPQTFSIRFLLKYHLLSGNTEALQQATLSLDKMICGGIYDHLGGGFARYSTDHEWLAPHFEKMLYDNALLISALADAYKLTGKDLYQRTIRETIDFIEREMTSDEGGFYAALDADSEGVEGKFYVWSYEEIEEILHADTALFAAFYDITTEGNWEHSNILRTQIEMEEFAASRNLHPDDFELLMRQCREKLLLKRAKRIRPALDDKIILGWNALMITAFSDAFAAIGEESYRQKAVKAYNFLYNKLKNSTEESFFHTYKNGLAKYPAFLDDYACLVQAAIHLQEITSDIRYIEDAEKICRHLFENFFDPLDSMFFYTNHAQDDVIVRKKEVYDGATPSGNSIMALNLKYLSVLKNDTGYNGQSWGSIAEQMAGSILPVLLKYPSSFGNWAILTSDYVTGPLEVAIVGPEYQQMRDAFLKNYLPGIVLQTAEKENPAFPLLDSRSLGEETLNYICRNYSCDAPFKELQKSVKALKLNFKIQ